MWTYGPDAALIIQHFYNFAKNAPVERFIQAVEEGLEDLLYIYIYICMYVYINNVILTSKYKQFVQRWLYTYYLHFCNDLMLPQKLNVKDQEFTVHCAASTSNHVTEIPLLLLSFMFNEYKSTLFNGK